MVGSLNITVEAYDFSKKCAQQKACQKLLKAIFPTGTTWNQMLGIVKYNKQHLSDILFGS